MTDVTISSVAGSDDLATTTARLLTQLPAWFGVPEANDAYVSSARDLPALVAQAGGQTVGVLLYRRHFPEAAEIHLMAIAPEWHRQGIGTAMIRSLVAHLRRDACQVLQVKPSAQATPTPTTQPQEPSTSQRASSPWRSSQPSGPTTPAY